LAFRPDFSWEFLSRDEIAAKSVRAVRNHVRHIKEVSPYYRETLAHVNPEDITTLDDIAKLPLTDKATLSNYADKFKAVPDDAFSETVATSGSTGKPLVFFMTQVDLERLAFNEALSFHAAGVSAEDKAQILISMDRLFLAGMAYYRGLTTLGVNTMRIGELEFEMQKKYLELLKPTILVGVPTYLKKFGEGLIGSCFNTRESSVNKIFCIEESLRDEKLALNTVGERLQDIFNAKAFSTYVITELSVAYCECVRQSGNHSHPELVYTEIVDKDGNPVPDGTPGELVGTPLGVEGMPLLRYRTGDTTFKIPGTCECGRNSDRIGPILKRSSIKINLKDKSTSSLAIMDLLDELDYVEDYVILIEDGGQAFSDNITLHVVTQPARVESIAIHLREQAEISLPILISNVPTLNSFRGESSKKAKVVDKREKKE
jgi:phenylacetate-CoA ligase